ncbi:unnamed protein product, partial [Oppiella nova]
MKTDYEAFGDRFEAVGRPGPPGPPGEVGLRGPPGIKGDAGQTGEPGGKGDVGPMGLPGPMGMKGESGSASSSSTDLMGAPGLDGIKVNWDRVERKVSQAYLAPMAYQAYRFVTQNHTNYYRSTLSHRHYHIYPFCHIN